MTVYVLALDTESSGLPPRHIPKGQPEWPFLVEVGCELFTMDGAVHGTFGAKVKTDGRHIQPGSLAVHGITEQDADTSGISEIAALAVIAGFAANASYMTIYNAPFDVSIIESSLILLGKSTQSIMRCGLVVVDLIEPCAKICKIPTTHESNTYRWPTLDVACGTILGDKPREKHHALDDAQRAKRLFLELVHRGMIELLESTKSEEPPKEHAATGKAKRRDLSVGLEPE